MIETIILAAGSSQRMGKENKLLKSYNDETIISHVIRQVLASDVSKVIVVTGHDDIEIKAACASLPITLAHNPHHLKGQLWSIRRGLEEITTDAQGLMILLGDMPLITPRHINDVIDHYKMMKDQYENVITRPIREKSIGHPTLWDIKLISAIQQYPEDERLKGLIQKNQDAYHPMYRDDDGYYVDIDTPEDYHDLLK